MVDYQPARLFTVEQANAMLPLVRSIVADISALAGDLLDRQQRLSHLAEGRQREVGDPYSDELAEVQRDLERDKLRLREYVTELSDLGVELKDPRRGLIDFPAKIDGRIVYLCWLLGEPEVLYWHDLESGFAGRQSLAAGAANGPGAAEDEQGA
mgnify:CR=1 FL=1